MPFTIEDTNREFGAMEQGMQQLQAKKLALSVPPPKEPLDPRMLQLLSSEMQRAVDAITGGQLPIQLGPPGADGAVPEDLAAAILGLEQLGAIEPGAAERLTSNEGVKDLIGQVGRAAQSGPPQAPEESQQPAAVPEQGPNPLR